MSAAHGSGDSHLTGVSVIMPVLNEEKYLAAAVDRILAQECEPMEIILAVGPSKDLTQEIATQIALRDSRVIVVDNPSGRTPDALNLAISHARYEVIVRVDGHAELPHDYIKKAVALLEETGADNVGGIMAAEGVTPFECAVATAMRSPLGVGAARFHTGGAAGPAETVYLGTFRRSALQRVGGYDPRYTRAQDWEMNLRLRKTGGLIWFSPELSVAYRPRPSLKALALQYRDYGRWRRVVIRRHQGTASLRYLAPPVALILNSIGLLGAFFFPLAAVIPATYLISIVIGAQVISSGSLRERLWLPLVLATMHMSWGWGFLTSPRALARD